MIHNSIEHPTTETAVREKRMVALSSVIAAVFLTAFKLTVGLSTNSLGILSEALHSGLDLIAALITFVAVRYADRPADDDHNFGHGKIENYSALIETILLVITCLWIVYEATSRLLGSEHIVEVTPWSFIVIITSIIIDYGRSKALMRVARKYNSQALEADALHFTTDILSSGVVLVGIIGTYFSMSFMDPAAALVVAIIVLLISYRIGKRSFDALIDRAPEGAQERISSIVKTVEGVKHHHDIKVRESGPYTFIELNIHVNREMTVGEAHSIAHQVEDEIKKHVFNARVTVHIEPDK